MTAQPAPSRDEVMHAAYAKWVDGHSGNMYQPASFYAGFEAARALSDARLAAALEALRFIADFDDAPDVLDHMHSFSEIDDTVDVSCCRDRARAALAEAEENDDIRAAIAAVRADERARSDARLAALATAYTAARAANATFQQFMRDHSGERSKPDGLGEVYEAKATTEATLERLLAGLAEAEGRAALSSLEPEDEETTHG